MSGTLPVNDGAMDGVVELDAPEGPDEAGLLPRETLFGFFADFAIIRFTISLRFSDAENGLYVLLAFEGSNFCALGLTSSPSIFA